MQQKTAVESSSEGAGPRKLLRTSGEIPFKRDTESRRREITPPTEGRPHAGNVVAGAHEKHLSGILLEDRTAGGLPSDETVPVSAGTGPSAFREEAGDASTTRHLIGAAKELIPM